MNLMIVGNDTESIARDIHKKYSICTIINNITTLKSQELERFIKRNKVIMLVDANTVMSYGINTILDLCERRHIQIALVSDARHSDEETIYYALEERMPEMLMWQRNPENKDYENFVTDLASVLANDSAL